MTSPAETPRSEAAPQSSTNVSTTTRREQPAKTTLIDTFLRQKEAELREKRQREQLEKGRKDAVQNGEVPAKEVLPVQPSVPVSFDSGTPASTLPVAANTSNGPLLDKSTVLSGQREHQTASDVTTKKSESPKISKAEQAANQIPASTPSPTAAPALPIKLRDAERASKRLSQHNRESLEVSVKDIAKGIPQFYFPQGKCQGTQEDQEATALNIKEVFLQLENNKAERQHMAPITRVNTLSSLNDPNCTQSVEKI